MVPSEHILVTRYLCSWFMGFRHQRAKGGRFYTPSLSPILTTRVSAHLRLVAVVERLVDHCRKGILIRQLAGIYNIKELPSWPRPACALMERTMTLVH